MINKIVELLKANKNVSAYKVTKSTTYSVELFYVTDKLETNRVTDTVAYDVVVYCDFDEYRGSSSFFVAASFTEEQIKEKIELAVARAKFVKNKFFELPKPEEKSVDIPSPISGSSFKDVACKTADAIFKANVYKDGWINSVEIFVTEKSKRIVNSNGIDLESTFADLYIELIPTWRGEHEEVELYQNIETSEINYEDITAKVEETMLNAKARANAIKLPSDLHKCNVILKSEEASMLFNYFKGELNYAVVYQHMNILNVGDMVNDLNTSDPIDITLKPYVVGASKAQAFDDDGVVLKDCHIIDNSKCMTLHGNTRYGYYLGEKNPTGTYLNMEVKPGSMSYDEMKKKPHILCVYFSSPQLDNYSGYYGGEVRLGFYFDGQKYTPVTGFSISGNIHEDKNKFRFSKEIETNRGYRGPKYIFVKDMTIN